MFKCEVMERLKRVEAKLDLLLERGVVMSKELDALTAQVKQNTDLETSAVTLIKGLADQIVAAKDDPTKLQALTDELKVKADALASAILANTPPAPPAP